MVPARLVRVSRSVVSTFAKMLLRRLANQETFQDKYRGHEQRWRLIEPYLPPPGSWVLDVGANLGRTIQQLSASGRYAVGIEVDEDTHLRWLTEAAPNCLGGSIMRAGLSPEDWTRIPRFDAVLLFSVLHRIYALQGPDVCTATLKGIGRRSDLIFIEAATRIDRFLGYKGMIGHVNSPTLPDFEDNRWESSTEWHMNYFLDTLPSHRPQFLGVVNHTEAEPFRPLFVLRRVASIDER